MTNTGTVKKWFTTGFGWIQRDDGSPDAFVHIRHCPNGYTPKEGDRVQFNIVVDARNARGRADNVRLSVGDATADVAADSTSAESEPIEWLKEHQGRHRGE